MDDGMAIDVVDAGTMWTGLIGHRCFGIFVIRAVIISYVHSALPGRPSTTRLKGIGLSARILVSVQESLNDCFA